MMATREPIYVAFWNRIVNDAGIKAMFARTGRFPVPVTDVTREECPALFLVQHGEQWEPRHNLDPKRTLQCSLMSYYMTPAQGQTYPATQLNAGLDVIQAALTPNNPQGVIDLDGLIDHLVIEGEIQIVEGVVGNNNASVLVVPVTLLIP